jgi:hypothetical protein
MIKMNSFLLSIPLLKATDIKEMRGNAGFENQNSVLRNSNREWAHTYLSCLNDFRST